jgi:hypothetical protein
MPISPRCAMTFKNKWALRKLKYPRWQKAERS